MINMAGLFSLVEWNNYIVSNVGVNFPNWAFFVINLILFSIILKLVYWLFKKVFRLFTSKTETTLDDDLIDAVEYPLIAILVIVFLISQMSFLTSNEFVLTWTHKVGIALIIISVTWFLYKLIGIIDKYGFTELARRTKSDFDDQLYPLLRKILRVILVLLAAFYILRWFEIDITPLIAGVGLGGLALAFAAQKVLGDIFGGVSIFTSEPFKKGDTVRTKDATGTVEEIGLRYTRIKTLDGTIEVIPNSIISSEPLENISKREKRKVVMTLGLTYETSNAKLKKAKEIIENILKSTNKIDLENYFISFDNFNASSLDIQLIYWITELEYIEYLKIRDSINTRIKDEFEKAKIEFAYPTQTIYVKK